MRQVYDTARQIKEKQDTYCEKVFQDEWTGLGEFPEELQWEALVDVLRGRVKVFSISIFKDNVNYIKTNFTGPSTLLRGS